MNRFIVSVVLTMWISTSFAEPPVPSPYGRIALRLPSPSADSEDSKLVDQALLDRVADILSQGGDGSEGEDQESEGLNLVDSDLFDRIARIISQNEGQLSSQSEGDGSQTPAIDSNYGVPPEVGNRLVGANFHIGRPEPARRIASFHIQEGGQNSQGAGGYSAQGYSNNAYTAPSPSSSRRLMFSEPQTAERIATFDIPESRAPQVNGGY